MSWDAKEKQCLLPWPVLVPGKHCRPSLRPTCHQPAVSAAPSSHSQVSHLLSARAKLLVMVWRGWRDAGSSRTAAGGAALTAKLVQGHPPWLQKRPLPAQTSAQPAHSLLVYLHFINN